MTTTDFRDVPGLGRVKLGDRVQYKRAFASAEAPYEGVVVRFRDTARGLWVVIKDGDSGREYATRGGMISHVVAD